MKFQNWLGLALLAGIVYGAMKHPFGRILIFSLMLVLLILFSVMLVFE